MRITILSLENYSCLGQINPRDNIIEFEQMTRQQRKIIETDDGQAINDIKLNWKSNYVFVNGKSILCVV